MSHIKQKNTLKIIYKYKRAYIKFDKQGQIFRTYTEKLNSVLFFALNLFNYIFEQIFRKME